jgi:hypothetical protein
MNSKTPIFSHKIGENRRKMSNSVVRFVNAEEFFFAGNLFFEAIT